jgi:hypothetical protein
MEKRNHFFKKLIFFLIICVSNTMDKLKMAYAKFHSPKEQMKREKVIAQTIWDREHPAELIYKTIIYPAALLGAKNGDTSRQIKTRGGYSDKLLISKHWAELQELCKKDNLVLSVEFNMFIKVSGWAD